MNIILFGCGKMGLSHAAMLNANKSIDKVFVVDKNTALLGQLKKNTELIPLSGDWKKSIKSENIEAAIIATPTGSHNELAIEAINLGLPVFIEKPLTDSYEKSKKLFELAKENNTPLLTGYVNRHAPVIMFAKDLIMKGTIGEPYYYANRMLGKVVSKSQAGGWRKGGSAVTGAMTDYGSHAINLALYFFGPNKESEILYKRSVFGSSQEDMGEIKLTHNDNVTGTTLVNWSDLSQRKAFNSFEVWGTSGYIKITKQFIQLFTEKENDGLENGWNQWNAPDIVKNSEYYLRGEDFENQVNHFLACIKDNKEWTSDFEEAVLTDEILDKFRNYTLEV